MTMYCDNNQLFDRYDRMEEILRVITCTFVICLHILGISFSIYISKTEKLPHLVISLCTFQIYYLFANRNSQNNIR